MKASLKKENIQNLVEDNREMLVPILILVAAVALFIVFILPNIISFPSEKGARDVEVAKLAQIKEAQAVLENTDEEKLTSEVELASKTLPSDKNFELILGAISQAASNSNTQIASYIFADVPTSAQSSPTSFSELIFEIKVNGGISEAANFINALYSSFPISDAKSISYTNGVSKILVSFYYSPFTSVSAQDAALAREKSPEEVKALLEIQKWSDVAAGPEILNISPEPVPATESASAF